MKSQNQVILFVSISGALALGTILANNSFGTSTGYKAIVYEVNPNPAQQVATKKVELAVAKTQPIANDKPKSVTINGVSVAIPGASSRKLPKAWGTYNAPGAIESWLNSGTSGFKTGSLKRSDLDAITAFEISRYMAEGNATTLGSLQWTTNSVAHLDPCKCSPTGMVNFGGDSAASVDNRNKASYSSSDFKGVFIGALAADKQYSIDDFQKMVRNNDLESIKKMSIATKLAVYLTLSNLNTQKQFAPEIVAKLKSMGIYESTPTSIIQSFFDQANQAGSGGVMDLIPIFANFSKDRAYLTSRLINLGVADKNGVVVTNNNEKIVLSEVPEVLLRLGLARTVFFNTNGVDSNNFSLHPTSLDLWRCQIQRSFIKSRCYCKS
jgi:hypothetical protein